MRAGSPMHLKRPWGFTLIEIAIGLVVIGAISAGIWAAVSSVNEKSRVNQLIQEYGTITQNMASFYQGRYVNRNSTGPYTFFACGGVAPNANPTVIANGVIPNAMVTSASTAVTPWGGGVVVYDPPGTGNPNTYRLSFYCIPYDACITLIMQAINCDPSQPGCPYDFRTYDVFGYFPDTPGAPGSPATWKNMTINQVNAACQMNTDNPAASDVEFDLNF